MIEKFLQHLRNGRGLQENTIDEYRKDLMLVDLWRQATKKTQRLEELTALDIEDYVADQLSVGTQHGTINRRLAAVRGYMRYLYKRGLIKEDTARLMENLKTVHKLPKMVELETVTAYLASEVKESKQKQTKALTALIAGTGLRISEALAIEYKDINKAASRIKIHGKGNRERFVYYSPAIAHYLNEYAKGQRNRIGRVFTYNYIDAYREMTTDIKTEDGRGLNPHQLRHLFASLQYEAGTELKTISEMLGHASLKTTELYTHLRPKTIEAAYKIGEVLS